MPDDDDVPLRHYLRDHEGVSVRFSCEACQRSRDVPVADVVARLEAKGLDGEAIGIRAVARFAERPCSRCGKMKWSTRPAFPLT